MSDGQYNQARNLLDQLELDEQVKLLNALLGEISADVDLKATQARTIRLLQSLGRDVLRQVSSAQTETDHAATNGHANGAGVDPEQVSEGAPEESALLARSNLTRTQFLMWMGQQINPDIPLYHVADAFHIHGPVNITAFQRAFTTLVAHTDALRTLIYAEDGVPRQQVQDGADISFALIDLSASQDPAEDYRAWLNERDGADLAFEEKLFDAALVKQADEQYVWYQGLHHAITDATSSDILFQRLADYYRAALAGRLAELSPPPQYGDFVRYERDLRQTIRYQQAAAYWTEKCRTPLPPTEFYGKSPVESALRAERVISELDATRSASLRTISGTGDFASPSQDLSLFTVFATALLTTLHRLTGQPVQRIGTLYNGRQTAAFQETAGLFIEMGAMQIAIDNGETFASLGKKVMAEALENLSYIQPGITSAEINRAVDVVLNFVPSGSPEFAGLPVTREPVHSGYIDADHSLRLWVTDYAGSGEYSLVFDMKADVFDETARGWFVEHFLGVLDALIADHTQAIGGFSLLSPAKHQNLLVDFNATDAPYPDQTVIQLFEAQVARTPTTVAAVEGDKSISYAGLNARANQLAHYLRAQGVGPEMTVAICMPRSIDVLIACWGVLKAGGAYIPIDPTYPLERIAYMVDDAGARIALTRDATTLSELVATAPMTIVNLATLNLTTYADTNPQATAQPDNLVYMIYTSGSTGKPKGVMLTHRGLMNYVCWARRAYQGDEVLDFPLYSSLAFDLTVTSLFVPLLSGGRIVVYGESDDAPGLEILDVFRDDAVDIVKLTPAHLALVRKFDLTNLRIRKLIVGGEDFKTELAQSIHEQFGRRVEIYNEYGPTEAVVGCMIHRYDPQRDTTVSVPIGTPAANARIYLLDEYDQPAPPGVVGEMVISSDGVARGYHNRPALTAERFGDDPFRTNARIYRSGDIARWDANGQVIFLGRRDHQVKVSGVRIELGEIEAGLKAHPEIQDVVVNVTQLAHPQDESEIVQCVTCGLPSNFPDVTFDADGVCHLCRDFDAFRDDVFQYFKTMDDLQVIVDRAKVEHSGDYDCMMLYSGGKDSTYVLGQLVEMGLNVLAFSLDNGYISEEAKENIRHITGHLGVDLVFGETPHMNAIFADSLNHFSNVCQGCYKVIYTLSMKLAREKGIKYIFTGLSRGQLFETRLDELFRNRMFDVDQMDNAVLEARKVYHRVDDAVSQLMDVSLFDDDKVFDEIQFIDYFRYTDVELDEVYNFLATRVPWVRPKDTGRSTNCLINEAGIFVHQAERGYHNYAHPYSWDVRLGHKTRAEALEDLDDDLRLPMVTQMLNEVGYAMPEATADRPETRLAAYYVAGEQSVTTDDLRTYLAATLPAPMIPTYFVRLDELPLTPNGKVDRQALPNPTAQNLDLETIYVAPESELETQLASIWAQTLGLPRIGVHDNFFELGGASIPAVQVVAKISDEFDVFFTVSHFFEHPTIAEQSEILEELLIGQLETMSDEEVEALLSEMGD